MPGTHLRRWHEGARISVVTSRPVWRRRGRASSRTRIAGARHVTWVGRDAGYGIATDARAALARVGLRASASVIARGPVCESRVGANPRRRVARPNPVTLVLGRARDRTRTNARAGLARVTLLALVRACGARGAVRGVRMAASPIAVTRVDGAGVSIVARCGRAGCAGPALNARVVVKGRAAACRHAVGVDGAICGRAREGDRRARRVGIARDVRARRHLELRTGDVDSAARRARDRAEIERAGRREAARHEEVERRTRIDRERKRGARRDRATNIELGMAMGGDCQRLRRADDRQVEVAAGQVDLGRIAAARCGGR
jgi:hypothetical protein